MGIDLGLLSSWLRLLLLLGVWGKQDSSLDWAPELFPQGHLFGYVEYHFRSRGHYCVCRGGAGGLRNGQCPAGWPRRVLSWDRPCGGPSLISYSEQSLLLGPLLPGKVPRPLHGASSILTTLPIVCCHIFFLLKGTPSLSSHHSESAFPRALPAGRVPACCLESHQPRPPPNRVLLEEE